MKIFFSILIIALNVHLLFGQNTSEQINWKLWNNGVYHSSWEFSGPSDLEIQEIEKRWDEIGASLKTTTNPFAGTYYKSGNRGYFLHWSPEKGFVYVYYYENKVIDASWGTVTVTDSDVVFKVEKEMQDKDRKTPTEWIPAFNKQPYLIKKKDIKFFGDFYGGFGDFNGYPLKWNCDCDAFAEKVDKNIDASKLKEFIVPNKYLKFIKYPLNGKIILVGKSYISTHPLIFTTETDNKASITPVTINLGKKSRIKRGLLFITQNSYLEVRKVGNKTSQAIIFRNIDDKGKEGHYDSWNEVTDKPTYKAYPPIRVGEKISTISFEKP